MSIVLELLLIKDYFYELLTGVIPYIAFTPSIGDDDLKPIVTAEPETTETLLSAEDKMYICQVMASDGLWDVASNTNNVDIIRDAVKEAGMCSKRLKDAQSCTYTTLITH